MKMLSFRSFISLAAITTACCIPMAIDAQALPYPPNTKIINERGGDLYIIECAPLTVCTIFLPANETPNPGRPINVGDPVQWMYDVNTAGGRWFVAVKPTKENLTETLQINTDRAAHFVRLVTKPFVRSVSYAFPDRVQAQANGAAPSPQPSPTAKPLLAVSYAIDGNASFRPIVVTTDGDRTFITVPEKSVQPTIYGIDASNQQFPIHVVPPRFIGDTVIVLDGTPNHFVMETGPGKKDERIIVRRTK